MDLATVLANVNARVYATPQQYLADIGRIVQVSLGACGLDCLRIRFMLGQQQLWLAGLCSCGTTGWLLHACRHVSACLLACLPTNCTTPGNPSSFAVLP